jgi:hypothetical protein
MARKSLLCAFFLSLVPLFGCSSPRAQSTSQVIAEQVSPVVEQSKRIVESSDSYFGNNGERR